jgi:hypothetical protein
MPTPVESTLVLEINQVGELFQAPALNPFSTRELEVLGQTGVEYVLKRVRRRWPRESPVHQLRLRLPASQLMPDLQARTEAALQRFCAEQIAENRRQLRLALDLTGREFLLATAVTTAVIVWVAFVVKGPLQTLPSPLLGALVLVPLLSASIAIWDALEGLVFGWIPYVIDNRAYRAVSALEVIIERKKDEE